MKIAVTGGTGFLCLYVLRQLVASGHSLQCWHRPNSDRTGLDDLAACVEWRLCELNDEHASESLVTGCDAVVHAALWRPGQGFRGAEGDVVEFAEKNVVGTLRLIEASRKAGIGRFAFISTCAVHEKILDDRPLDEKHPTWTTSHYGVDRAVQHQAVSGIFFGPPTSMKAEKVAGVFGFTAGGRMTGSSFLRLIES